MQRHYWAGLGMVLAATAAGAQPDTPAPFGSASSSQSFITLDTNGDGALSRSELGVRPELQRGFEDRDRNKDGTLSMLEFSVAPAPAPGVPQEAPEPLTVE